MKLCDFGLGKDVSSQVSTTATIGAPFYRAPELEYNSPLTHACDIWSLGIIAAKFSHFEFTDKTEPTLAIPYQQPQVPPEFSQLTQNKKTSVLKLRQAAVTTIRDNGLRKIVEENCLCFDPAKRSNAIDLVGELEQLLRERGMSYTTDSTKRVTWYNDHISHVN